MHSSWYCRRRIFNGGPTGLTIEDAVAYRRRTREVEHSLHFWRRVNNPLDAGGMSEALSVSRLNDIESVVHLRTFRAWRGPTRIPARISSPDRQNLRTLLYSVSTASSTFYFLARRLPPPRNFCPVRLPPKSSPADFEPLSPPGNYAECHPTHALSSGSPEVLATAREWTLKMQRLL
jgi:hypothetical protein